MSKTFVKQASLESPGLSGRRPDMDSPKPLNRSLTMVDRRTTPGTGLAGRQTREPTSPLKRFTRAKENISKAFGLIRERLTESQAFFQLAHKGVESRPVAALLERTQGIQDILSRDHMKVGDPYMEDVYF